MKLSEYIERLQTIAADARFKGRDPDVTVRLYSCYNTDDEYTKPRAICLIPKGDGWAEEEHTTMKPEMKATAKWYIELCDGN